MEKEDEFQPFHKTYRAAMYSMSFGMMYPNPVTDKWRLLAIPGVLLSVLPMTIIISLDIRQCWIDGNTLEVIRHFAMTGPFITGVFKMILLYAKRVTAKSMIDIINNDYAAFNYFPKDEKRLVKSFIKSTHHYHLIWFLCVLMIFSTFVLSTTVFNIYEHLFRSTPQRHMIYDVNLPNKEPGAQFETPYFEMLYAYMLFVALIYCIHFTGYDGFMLTAINHACLKMGLFCKLVGKAMRFEGEERKKRLGYAVQYQCRTFEFIKMCQSAFNGYLGMIYAVVTTELCVCFYLMTEGYEFDYKFTAFSVGTILHIYIPCQIADKLKDACENASTFIYFCGWENVYDLPTRRYIPFMIARAQSPVTLQGFGLFTYEMDLFVSTVKTAYSLYTLIKTQQN